MRCLIVDDSAQFCAAASAMLERAGMTVDIASDGVEALRSYRAHRPDVTLVDIDLGVESGFDIAEQLHRAAPSSTPVILISTHDEQDLADMIASSSAVGFLPKIALSPAAIQHMLAVSG
ncbi:response regulator [Mycobacterium sp. NPDC003449]